MRRFAGLAVCIAAALFPVVAAAECTAPPAQPADAPAIIEACNAILQANPPDAERADLLMKRGRAFKRAGKLTEAAADPDEAIKLAPRDPAMRQWRAWIAIDSRDYQYAAALAEQALSLRPDSAPAYDLIGTVAAETGNLAGAREAFNKAVDVDPGNVHARYSRYYLYRNVGAQREQLSELDALLALKSPELDAATEKVERKAVPLRVKLRLQRAALLEAMGRDRDAAKAYDDFVRDEPGAVSYGYRATYRHRHEDNTRALEDIDDGLKDDRQFAYLHMEKGFIFNSMKRYDEAVAAFTHALEIYPPSGAALWGRAMARRALDQQKLAVVDAQVALVVDRNFLMFKAQQLMKRGYLPESADEKDVLDAVKDAAQACMIDTGCW